MTEITHGEHAEREKIWSKAKTCGNNQYGGSTGGAFEESQWEKVRED